MKKGKIILGSAIMLVILLVTGGTLAWFTSTTEPVLNEFTAGTLEIELVDEFEGAPNVNPGDCYDKVVYVKNLGTKKAMVRVHESTIIENYNMLGLENVGEANMDIIKFQVNENWHHDVANNYFYYKNVLEPGAETQPILEGQICFDGPSMGNQYQGSRFQIILEADAIQATNGAPGEEGWMFDPLGQ